MKEVPSFTEAYGIDAPEAQSAPLAIMDEIEPGFLAPNTDAMVTADEWNALRTAIKRQNERIDMLKSQTESLAQEALDKSDELAQARARIGRLEDALKFLTNSDNYLEPTFHPEEIALEALNESEPQSLAAVKAEALHEFGNRLFAEQVNNPNQDFAKLAHDEADRIEREAKED